MPLPTGAQRCRQVVRRQLSTMHFQETKLVLLEYPELVSGITSKYFVVERGPLVSHRCCANGESQRPPIVKNGSSSSGLLLTRLFLASSEREFCREDAAADEKTSLATEVFGLLRRTMAVRRDLP